MIAVAQLISAVWALVMGSLSLVLLGVAVTWDGRAFALAAVLVSFAPLVASFGRESKRQRRRPAAIAMVVGALVLSSVLLWRAPSGEARPDSKVRHLYVDGKSHFRRFALGNLLPEVDQTRLGFTLVRFVDPLFTHRQSIELKRLITEIYSELDHDPDFHALGSVMPDVYDDVWGWRFDRGHSFLYVPSGYDHTKALPALMFLHGSGGNFKAYLWILSRLADRLNVALIAPSYGMGNWNRTDAESLVKAAISACSRQVQIDRNNLHVLGFSNGGLAVSQLLQTPGAPFRSFLFLSPVFDEVRFQPSRNWSGPQRPPFSF